MTEEKREYMRQYREKNRAHISELNRKRYLEKREEIKSYVMKRYTEKKDEILAQQKARRERPEVKERDRANRTEWARKNRDKVRLIAMQVYWRTRDKRRVKNKEWRDANPEKFKVYAKRYHAKHPEIRRHRAAQRRAGQSKLTRQQIADLIGRQAGFCHWCRKPYGEIFELDHVIPVAKGGGNGIENLVLACRPCNRRKGSKLPHEFAGVQL